jgi:hypothetical protein
MLFKFFYFHIFTCSLIWLNLPMDDPHFGLSPNWKKKALPHVPSPSTFHPCHVHSQLHSSVPCQLPSTFIHAMQTLRTVIHSGTIPSTFIHTSTLIFLVFRLWTQEVDVQHLIYWQGQRVCDALFCFILSVEISQTTLLHAMLLVFSESSWWIGVLPDCLELHCESYWLLNSVKIK